MGLFQHTLLRRELDILKVKLKDNLIVGDIKFNNLENDTFSKLKTTLRKWNLVLTQLYKINL